MKTIIFGSYTRGLEEENSLMNEESSMTAQSVLNKGIGKSSRNTGAYSRTPLKIDAQTRALTR